MSETTSSPQTAPVQTVAISLDDRSYDIQIGQGLLSRPDTWVGLPKASTAMVVTNDTIAPLYEAAFYGVVTALLFTLWPLAGGCVLRLVHLVSDDLALSR